MSAKRPHGLFITGTNTGVGKTYVACLIAAQLVREGKRVGVYKPALSGSTAVAAERAEHELQHCQDDDVLLWQAAGRAGELARVCPQRFAAPVAPHLAARLEGRELDAPLMRSGIEYWRERSEVVLVEGAGGLMSPLGDEYVADVARDFGYPLVIVAANVLGVINQVMQTIVTARSVCPKLPIAGVVLNQLPHVSEDSSQSSNLAELQMRCGVPVVECRGGNLDVAALARAWAE